MLVLDANVALASGLRSNGLRAFGRERLIAPPLLWPEARAALHQAVWRGLLSRLDAVRCRDELDSGRLQATEHATLGPEAWRIADELGWSKTYDAEYLALASIFKATLMTFDSRMSGAARRLGLHTQAPS